MVLDKSATVFPLQDLLFKMHVTLEPIGISKLEGPDTLMFQQSHFLIKGLSSEQGRKILQIFR